MTREPRSAGRIVDVDALYLDERSGLVRLAFLLTGSSETAEDVVQDAFERSLSRLDRVDKPGAYLRTAVVNGARSKMRRERSAPVLPAPIAAELGESALELWAALRTLSERRRTAMVLRYWADLPRQRDRGGHGLPARHRVLTPAPRTGRPAKGAGR
ncbi:MAG: sigma factor [Acidimicrobiales bacterium]